MKLLRQIFESMRMAWQSVMINKMRTFLSLLGITIGIFSIISVYTAIDSMERYIRSSFDAFGTNTLFIGKWPWMPEGDGEYKWWKYMNRPETTIAEFRDIQDYFGDRLEAGAIQIAFNRTLKYDKSSRESTQILGVNEDFPKLSTMEIDKGRFLSLSEIESGSPVAVIGSTIAEDLFDGVDPLGKSIKIGGRSVTVVGTFKREGDNMFGVSNDANVATPLNFARTIANMRYAQPQIIIKARDNENLVDFKAETEQAMRQVRRLPMDTENNFTINEITAVSDQLSSIFDSINLVGGIIGIFAILVGGFGVANIMFVSVRERTSQIGIQKAVGAKPYFILLQFLVEAVLLSIVGGLIGLLLIWIGAMVVSRIMDFEILLTMKNIIIGLGISSVVGAFSGFFPAWSAAQMQPVKAIYKT